MPITKRPIQPNNAQATCRLVHHRSTGALSPKWVLRKSPSPTAKTKLTMDKRIAIKMVGAPLVRSFLSRQRAQATESKKMINEAASSALAQRKNSGLYVKNPVAKHSVPKLRVRWMRVTRHGPLKM